jgi:hypothetical protein
MMTYQISIQKRGKVKQGETVGRFEPVEGWIVGNIEAAREEAQRFVQDRMDAFGEDREALERYGYIAAENAALELSEDGGEIRTADGWLISVQPTRI